MLIAGRRSPPCFLGERIISATSALIATFAGRVWFLCSTVSHGGSKTAPNQPKTSPDAYLHRRRDDGIWNLPGNVKRKRSRASRRMSVVLLSVKPDEVNRKSDDQMLPALQLSERYRTDGLPFIGFKLSVNHLILNRETDN
uniref:Uncharacterized protein n=1 Tax=Anopheles merus TaxID=30066 RepID=A0A182VHJ0_ANOME